MSDRTVYAEFEGLAAEIERLRAVLDDIGRFAASYSGRDGQDVLLAAVYRIAESCEAAIALIETQR